MPIILQEKRHRVTCCPEAIFKRTLPFASAYSFNSYEPVSAPPAYSRLWGQGANTTRSLPSARFQRGKRRPSFPAEWSQAACGGAVDTDGAGDEQRRRQHSAPEVTGQLSRRALSRHRDRQGRIRGGAFQTEDYTHALAKTQESQCGGVF